MKIYRYRKKGVHHRLTVGSLNFNSNLAGNWTCHVGYLFADKNGQKQIKTDSRTVKCKKQYLHVSIKERFVCRAKKAATRYGSINSLFYNINVLSLSTT